MLSVNQAGVQTNANKRFSRQRDQIHPAMTYKYPPTDIQKPFKNAATANAATKIGSAAAMSTDWLSAATIARDKNPR